MMDGELRQEQVQEQAESVVPGDMIRELDEIHKLFDALGVESGYAADRLRRWFERKVTLLRANGHVDSCQCQFCCEDRVVRRAYQKLRNGKATMKG